MPRCAYKLGMEHDHNDEHDESQDKVDAGCHE